MSKNRLTTRQIKESVKTGWGLGAVSLFVAALTLIRLLDSIVLPSVSPWNVVWLGIEALIGAGAAATMLLCLIRAVRQNAASRVQFQETFSEMKQPVFFIALAWCVWSFIACFLAAAEGRAPLSGNIRYLFYMASSLLVIFPLGYHLGKRRQMALFHAMFDTCLVVFSLFLLYAYFRFFRGEFHFFTFGENEFDFTLPRIRFGVNPNSTAAYGAFFLIGGLYRFHSLQNSWKRALLVFFELIAFTAFVYSESRTAFISLALALGVWIGARIYRRKKDKGSGSVLLSLLCAVVTAVLTVAVLYGVLNILRSLQSTVLKSVVTHAGTDEGPADDRGFMSDNALTLGGRIRIWLAIVKEVFRNRHLLLHGCSQSATSAEVYALIGKSYNTHNQFLEVLLAYGLPALVLFLVWLLWLAGKSVFLGLDRSEEDDPSWMLPLILLMMIVDNLAETMLVARIHFVGFLFFLLAGYVGGLADLKKEVNK